MIQRHMGVSFHSLAGAVDDFRAGDPGDAGGDAQAPKRLWSVLPDNAGTHLLLRLLFVLREMLWGQALSGLAGAGASSQSNACPVILIYR